MNYIALTWMAIILTACNIGKDYTSPDTSHLSQARFEEQDSERFNGDKPVKEWWQQLEDQQLSTLVDQALTSNHDIRLAYASLKEARALLDASQFDRFPTITANASATRQELSNNDVAGSLSERRFARYDTGFDATWELDLFGRVSQTIAASNANYEVKEAELYGAYVSIAAEVARTYIELRGAQYRLNVAQKNAENQTQTYELTQALTEDGQGDLLNIERARTQLALTRSEIPLREAEVNAAINRLSVLVGKSPDTLQQQLATIKPLPSIPASISVGDPALLLKRRPDIHAAERELARAVAEYNINVTDLYPRVSLVGSIGFIATSFADLGTGGASRFLFGPNVDWAAFNMGRVKQQVDASDARAEKQLIRFEQTVLRALEEIDTAMVNFSRSEKSRARLLEAAEASSKAAIYARQRFDAGIDSFLDVLDAERTMLDAQDRLARSETNVAIHLIAIYKALGGGWMLSKASQKQLN